MPKIKLSEYATTTIKEVCASFNHNEGELINVLHQVQHHFIIVNKENQLVIH